MTKLILLTLLLSNAFAADKVQEIKDFFSHVDAASKKADWYGKPTEDGGDCGVVVELPDGNTEQRVTVIQGDINNDGVNEYVLLNHCGGSLDTDTILEAFQKRGDTYESLNIDKVLEKNGIDGSQIPFHFAKPFWPKKVAAR